jgi:hypothetical protein
MDNNGKETTVDYPRATLRQLEEFRVEFRREIDSLKAIIREGIKRDRATMKELDQRVLTLEKREPFRWRKLAGRMLSILGLFRAS